MKHSGQLFPQPNPLQERFSAEFFRKIPQTPGVYFFKGKSGEILYVGKAKNLKKRVSSYKQGGAAAFSQKLPSKIRRMIHQAESIEWKECQSEEEALLLENHFLRTLKPPYNRANTKPEYYFYLNVFEHPFEIKKNQEQVVKWIFDFSHSGDPTATFTLGAFKSKNRSLQQFFALLRLQDFLNQPLETYTTPTPLLFETSPIPFSDSHPERLRALLLGTAGVHEVFQSKLDTSLISSGFTHFRLKNDLEDAHLFVQKLQQIRRYLLEVGSSNTFIQKEELDDMIVRERMKK